MNRKFHFTLIIFLCISFLFKNEISYSQNSSPVTFGKVTPADFDLPKINIIDSNTNAVIMASVGSIDFIGDKKYDRIDYELKQSERIKIINKKAFGLATKKIYIIGKTSIPLNNFHATTYNLENGKVTETQLSVNDIFEKKINSYEYEKSFTMPNIKEGSIIEVSFTFTSPYTSNLPGWNFQFLDYPCLYNEFKLNLPDLLSYLVTRNGTDSFYSFSSAKKYTNLLLANLNVGTEITYHSWVMKNIPAFEKEDYMYNPSKYLDKFEFTESQFYNGREIENITTDWKSKENELLSYQNFGSAIKMENTDNLNSEVQRICTPQENMVDDVKKIYRYVRDNFTCFPNDDIFIQHDLYDVNKSKKGNVAELNLLLIALLRDRGLKADPVILATRSYGNCPETYPVLENLNYVICMVTNGDQTIYLDASDPDLGFGKLPLECYNGHAEIIDPSHSGSIYLNPEDIKNPETTTVLLVNNEKGGGESGSVENIPGYYTSVDIRSSFKEKDGQQKYIKELQKEYGPDVTLSNFHIDSLDQPESPVKINYDLNFTTGFDADILYFDPVVNKFFNENPFKATQRKYPVELPYPYDYTYDLTMDIPNGFVVDEVPKSVNASFNGTEGNFLYQITKDQYTVQLHMKLKLNKTVFAPEDYTSLRDFFAMVVKKQTEQVVFKKK